MISQNFFKWEKKSLEKLDIEDHQFFDYLKAGLQPYEKHTRKPIHCPYEHHAYTHKLNRLDEIKWLLNSFTDLDDLENKVEETKPYTFYVKRISPFVDEYFSKHHYNIFLRPIANKGYPMNFMILQKLKTYKDELTEEKPEIENELEAIVKDDSDVHSWKYFVIPSSDKCEKIKADLIERAVFKKDVATRFKEKLSLEFKNEEGKQESDFIFRHEGPSWTITYEGKTLRGFTGKGFKIIHYLICKKGQVFHISELAKEIDKMDLDESKKLSQINSEKERDEGNRKKDKKQLIDGRDMIYGKTEKEIKDYYYYLKNELREAENNHDPGRIEKADKELANFTKYMNSYFKKGGKSRQFADDITRAKGRISKRIERALKSLNKQDEKMYRHFLSALRPVNSFLQSYTPDRDIDWLT